MADRRLRHVEKLVQDSVFHPSPCRRLRERVVHKAVQATHRQRLGRRTAVVSAFAVALIVLPLVALRLWVGQPSAAKPQAEPVVAPTTTGPHSSPANLKGPNPNQPLYGVSPGEAYFYGKSPLQPNGASGVTPIQKTSVQKASVQKTSGGL